MRTSFVVAALAGVLASRLVLQAPSLCDGWQTNHALFVDIAIDPLTYSKIVNSRCAAEFSSKLETYLREQRLLVARRAAEIRAQEKKGEGAHEIEFSQIEIDTHKGPIVAPGDFSDMLGVGPILDHGGLENHQVVLTFDDGPHPLFTPRIAGFLKEAGVTANFFSCGKHAKVFPQVLRSLVKSGHVVGSHTMNHPHTDKLSMTDYETDILQGREEVAKAAGVAVPFFRFPYGQRTPDLIRFVEKLPMGMFFWDIDSRDWDPTLQNSDVYYSTLIDRLNRHQKGVVLFHDIQLPTQSVLPEFLKELALRKFKVSVFIPGGKH